MLFVVWFRPNVKFCCELSGTNAYRKFLFNSESFTSYLGALFIVCGYIAAGRCLIGD